MNIDNLTIAQLKEIAALAGRLNGAAFPIINECNGHDSQPVIVCTDKRGVVFGYSENIHSRPMTLTKARMCLYWSADVGGVFGLAEAGPTKDCKISATLPQIILEGVTCVMSVDAGAEKAWTAAKTTGR